MPKVSGIRVVRSPIDGYGVIAAKPFAEDELISEVDGVAWRDGDGVDDRYSLWVDEGMYYDMVDQTRFINHSCDPNAKVDAGITDDGQTWATITALRPIAVGEELSYDYAFPADLAELCRCGSPRCRGLIVDEDALPLARSLALALNSRSDQ
jgi:SET domain-containing protein